jgi:CubicO group peptidase (beta-lactamase class C family)
MEKNNFLFVASFTQSFTCVASKFSIKWLLSFFLVAGSGITAFTQDKSGEIDKIFNWVAANTPGCVCAVSQNGTMVANRAYGSADLERNVAMSTSSVLDAGSVVKQFVAASVLLLVEEGKLSLTADIRNYIPELPDYGHKLTLDHLLTHTSGIRDWTGIRSLAEGDPDALTLTLRQKGLNFKPGDEWSYSNSGYVLLKEIIARTSGLSFSDFTRQRIFEPLKMEATAYVQDLKTVVKNRALAYKKEGNNWKLDVELGNDRGGGGALLTTPADLLRWNEALAKGQFGSFVTKMLHQPATLNNGRTLEYARGLMLDSFRRGGTLVWHSGGAAGYSTLLARLPEQGLSLALMCNVDGGARSALGGRIFDLYLPPAGNETSGNNGAPANNTTVDVKDKAGLFFHEKTGQPLRLVVNNNILTIAGGGPLVALASDRFKNRNKATNFLSGAEFELQFRSADRFEIKTKEGETISYYRAKVFTPSANDLREYSGQYESHEMGSVLEIVPVKEALFMRFYRNPAKAVKLSPVDTDTFMLGMMTVRFQRDKTGKVTGYHYSNPLVRNIPFTKLKETD